MKILYVSKADIPSRTANSFNIMSSCAAMAELGHEVTLCAPKIRNSETEAPFSFYGVMPIFSLLYQPSPNIPGGRSLYCHRLKKCARSLMPELVFGRYRRGLLALARKGWPVVVEMHTIVRSSDRRMRKELLDLTAAPGFVGLVTLTQTMAEHFEHLALPGLSSKRILVAHCGSDPPKEIQYRHLPRKTSGWQIGYAGSLKARKGMALLSEIAQRLTGHDFHIFGGSQADIDIWKKRMPWEHVHFHGFVSPGQLPHHLASVDLCVLPNQQAPWNRPGEIISSPLKLFDYMALGKTILSSDFKEVRENVSEREAILLPHDQPWKWIEAIEHLTQEEAKILGHRARQLFDAQLTRKKRYQGVLETICNQLLN